MTWRSVARVVVSVATHLTVAEVVFRLAVREARREATRLDVEREAEMMRRWCMLDNRITEARQEAIDRVAGARGASATLIAAKTEAVRSELLNWIIYGRLDRNEIDEDLERAERESVP